MSAPAADRVPEVTGRGSQTAIPCLFMRGGTSRGPFFDARLLPRDPGVRDAVLLAAMGSPDPRQIDGIGGAHPLTSKIGLVRPATEAGADLEWTFAQVQPGRRRRGHVVELREHARRRPAVRRRDRHGRADRGPHHGPRVDAQHRHGRRDHRRHPGRPSGARHVAYDGAARIDGVPDTAAPVEIGFLDTAGSVAGSLLPTGRARDTVEVPGLGAVDVTLIDNGQPLVIVAAARLGATGYGTLADIDADEELKARVEALRLVRGHMMGLGDVAARNYPKMTLVAPARNGGTVSTRSLIPRVETVHRSAGRRHGRHRTRDRGHRRP